MKGDSIGPHTRPQDMCSVSDCFKEFERLILMHAMNAPPEKLEIFKGKEVRLMTDFASTTLFKHFLLHQYCLNFDREVETIRVSMGLERPWAPDVVLDLKGAKERAKEEQKSSQEVCETTEGGEQPQEDAAVAEEDTEEQEIERLVALKLEETKAKLEAKLQTREQAFHENLQTKKNAKK